MAKKHTVIIDDTNDGESKNIQYNRRFYRGRVRRKSCQASGLSPKRAQVSGTSKPARNCARKSFFHIKYF